MLVEEVLQGEVRVVERPDDPALFQRVFLPLALAVDDIALVHVRACDLIAHFMQDLHQREHAAAANAHKVQLGFAVQQFAVECVHIYHLVKIRLVLLTLYIDLMVK